MRFAARRRFLSSAAALAAATLTGRRAHGAESKLEPGRDGTGDAAGDAARYAVISLLGDEITLVHFNSSLGSSLDRNVHRAVLDASVSFDKFALAAAGAAIEQQVRGSAVTLLSVGPSDLHQHPEQLIEGRNLALPSAWVDAVERSGATRLLLLTKYRAPARVPLAHSTTGVGGLSGLGYYVDRWIRLRSGRTNGTGTGLLAPYVYAQLTLADARSGLVLKQQTVTASQPFSVAGHPAAMDPWEVLDADEKVARLRRLLEQALTRGVGLLLAA